MFVLFGALLLSITIAARNTHPPRLVVVLVIDQFAHHYIDKLYPHLKYGIKYIIDHGVYYTNANYDSSGQPGTAGGHASLGTGVGANYHGFTSNSWYENGKKRGCDDDDSGDALVIVPNDGGAYDYGKSACSLMVDGLSDQCVLQARPDSAFAVYSVSGKSRSAIGTAGWAGKPLWFDCKTGLFTSSKAYFDTLPEWVQEFNSKNPIEHLGSIKWKRMYPRSPYAYDFFDIDNYEFTRTKETMLDRPLAVPNLENPENPYDLFEKTPYANQRILDCSLACIKEHVSRKTRDRLLLWVCLSPLDKVAHQYGPNSMEATDIIYHLDKQIQRFMRKTLRIIGKHELVFALTADHGVMPIPELIAGEGFGKKAQRIEKNDFIGGLNSAIKEEYAFDDAIIGYKGQSLAIDPQLFNKIDADQHSTFLDFVKQAVMKKPGIKNAWTIDEIISLPTQPDSLEAHIKKQIFKGRSGSLIIQPYPYTVITHWKEGAAHKTPYGYDTHVPLVLFYPGKFERKYVRQRVSPLQLPNTLAELLNVPKPSASVCEILPELFDPEYK